MHGSRRWFAALALALGALAVLPVAAIVGRGMAPGAGETWAHLAATVLPRYVGNTLALVVQLEDSEGEHSAFEKAVLHRSLERLRVALATSGPRPC